ncbi:MAG: hypothetical protein HQK49_10100 [Oligoflexia bacterium]|nr:hypothetical protein [Oligoflexia bacterium]
MSSSSLSLLRGEFLFLSLLLLLLLLSFSDTSVQKSYADENNDQEVISNSNSSSSTNPTSVMSFLTFWDLMQAEQQYYKKGAVAYNLQDYSTALEYFNKIKRSEYLLANSIYYRALILNTQMREEDALAEALSIFELNKTNPVNHSLLSSTYFLMGNIYYKLNQPIEAKKYLLLAKEEISSKETLNKIDHLLLTIDLAIDNQSLDQEDINIKRLSLGVNIDFFQYDSNVMSLPQNTNEVNNKDGIAFGSALWIGYSPLITKSHEFAVKYLFQFSYHPDKDFVRNDLWTHNISTPLSFKQIASSYSDSNSNSNSYYSLTTTPGFSKSFTQNDNIRKIPPRQGALAKFYLNNKIKKIITDSKTVMNLDFNLRYEDNKAWISNPLENASGTGVLLGGNYNFYSNSNSNSNSNFNPKSPMQLQLGPNLDYFYAKGDNYKSYTFSLYSVFSSDFIFTFSQSLKLTLYYQLFYKQIDYRKDSRGDLEWFLTTTIYKNLIFNQLIVFTLNNSTVATKKYRRFLTSSSLTLLF